MEMNINKVLSLLLSKLRYIVLITLIFALLSFGYTKLCMTEMYTASAKFLVIMDESSSKSTEANFVKEAIHSYMEIFNTTKFFNEVADAFNEQSESRIYTASELKSMTSVRASADSDAPSFNITVTSTSPDVCYNLANTVSSTMIKKASDYKVLNRIELIDDPIKPVVPSSPNIINNTVSGLAIGAILSCFFFIFIEMIDKKINNLEDITNNYDIPILGIVPNTSPEMENKRTKKIVEDQ